jgi:hypothetical protein
MMNSIKNLYQRHSISEMLVLHSTVFIFSLTVLSLSFYFTPEDLDGHRGLASLLPKCLFKSITGIPCPTCGMGRAFSSFSRCEFRKAMSYNKLSIIFYPIALALPIFSPLSLCLYFLSVKKHGEAT